MTRRYTALKVLLALVGLAHLVLGLTANLAPTEAVAKVVSEFYSATLEITPQSHHLIRMIGAFMIGIAVMAFVACRNPQRNQTVIFGIVTILALRVIQRIVFFQEISSSFDIPPMRIWLQALFFLATAVALLVLCPNPEQAERR